MIKMNRYLINHLFVIFVMLLIVNNVNSIKKRSDIELESCIENFDVHKDKIIRTQDSRNMGAKYLNEIDLGSREECLRLCCETDTCDVFVYEEKSPGSCYLFHCGPPEDFKCKFTRHANYSSAVLTVNRHLNELENQIKLTKHEQDLTKLRNPDETRIQQQEISQRVEVTRIPPTQVPTTTTLKSKVEKEILPQIEPTSKTIAERRCSQYQFECRTSGECIGIYNACDGIPQCSDGSDEAPELSCPELTTTEAPSHPPPPLHLPMVHNNIYGQTNQLRKSIPPLMDNTYQQPPVIQSNPRLPLPVDIGRESTDFLRPPPPDNVRVPPVPQQNIYNEPHVIQQPQQAFIPPRPSNTNNWIPHHNNQMPVMPQNVQYADKNSHIFNHKESGLQVVDTPDSAGAPAYADMNVRNDYQKIPNYYGDMYRSQYQIPENWQPNRMPINPDVNPYVNNDNWQPVQVPQNQPINNNNNINNNNKNNDQANTFYQTPDVKPNWKQDLINTKADSKAYDHTIIHEPKNFEQHQTEHKEPSHETKPVVNEHHTSKEHEHDHEHEKKHEHNHGSSSAEHLKQNIEELIDGEAERPGGAVLSLTLGVCLTCVMAVLIGCRLRVVRRRMRRGGKSPYAHDADYLVNGMYL